MTMLTQAEKIADKARKSISKFCIEECKAYCCRKGYLILDDSNVNLVTQGNKDKLMSNYVLKELGDERYSFFLGHRDHPCPSLKDHRCMIHSDDKRPLACKNFPLFIEDDILRLSPRCVAVKLGMLYPYVTKLLKMNLKLSKTNSFSELEL